MAIRNAAAAEGYILQLQPSVELHEPDDEPESTRG